MCTTLLTSKQDHYRGDWCGCIDNVYINRHGQTNKIGYGWCSDYDVISAVEYKAAVKCISHQRNPLYEKSSFADQQSYLASQ